MDAQKIPFSSRRHASPIVGAAGVLPPPGLRVNTALSPQQLIHGRADIGTGHQRLADEHGLDAGRFQTLDVLPAADAALAHDDPVGGNLAAASATSCSRSISKVRKSRLLMPISRAPAASTRARLAGS